MKTFLIAAALFSAAAAPAFAQSALTEQPRTTEPQVELEVMEVCDYYLEKAGIIAKNQDLLDLLRINMAVAEAANASLNQSTAWEDVYRLQDINRRQEQRNRQLLVEERCVEPPAPSS